MAVMSLFAVCNHLRKHREEDEAADDDDEEHDTSARAILLFEQQQSSKAPKHRNAQEKVKFSFSNMSHPRGGCITQM